MHRSLLLLQSCLVHSIVSFTTVCLRHDRSCFELQARINIAAAKSDGLQIFVFK